MLKLINITKTFKYGNQSQLILNNINLNFKSKELVFILGPSGSGKSTLLNIIGGLITPDSGKIYLNNECLSDYSLDQLSQYRNNNIGLIFQHYHLIEHMTVLDNLKICQNKPNYQQIDIILKQLNIFEKKHTEVSLLSGGEKERVAIARAIINNPNVILCDEPTGALDRINAQKVMEILKKISKQKLVIVVSHDQYLAKKYADRIINIQDGQINTPPIIEEHSSFNINMSKINKLTILKLALKNLLTTKKRTILTALATSIGIITILLVAFLSTGFNNEVSTIEEKLITSFPITIKNTNYEIPNPKVLSSTNHIIVKEQTNYFHSNNITAEYINYLKNNSNYRYLLFHYNISMPTITDYYQSIPTNYLKLYPNNDYLIDNYKLISGNYPQNIYEIVLQIDSNNNTSQVIADSFNLSKEFSYDKIIGRIIKIPLNDEYYLSSNNYFYPEEDYQKLYNRSSISLKIVGIVKEKEPLNDNSFLLYSERITTDLINKNKNSIIVQKQLTSPNNLISLPITREELLSYLGYNPLPYQIDIYFSNIKSKEIFTEYLNKYSNTKIIYEDPMKETIKVISDFINIISIILIIFSLISIFVSSIMTNILTNTRIMERIKEIGILRSLGATSKNIKMLFNTENFIISLLSSIISFIVVIILKYPLNNLINHYLEISNMYQINYYILLLVVILNSIIIVATGLIPTTKASKLDIIECLRKG